MSAFECPVVRVTIEPHPNADAIEVAIVGGYRSIVKKGQFVTGDLAVYLPEFAVLPEWMLKGMGFWDEMNNRGTLTSSAGNRIKAIKLRGVLSQGILLGGTRGYDHELRLSWVTKPATEDGPGQVASIEADEGANVAEYLGVVKWEPVIPTQMAGRVAGGDLEATIGYDFENIKKNPELFDDGMQVVMTEKLHGTLLQVGIIPQCIWEGKPWADKCPDIGEGFKGIVTSKGRAPGV